MTPWYSLPLGTEATTKPDVCYLLTLNVKNTVHLGDGDIWFQLVETFQLFELTFIWETAYGEASARYSAGYQTLLL